MDVRISGTRVIEVNTALQARGNEAVVDAGSGLLLPGLHDHHIHLMAFAASLDSRICGPPDVQSAAQLAELLRSENSRQGQQWFRGIAYHPCVAGDIDREWLDRFIPHRPARIQHRGGRLWVFNSRALSELQSASSHPPPGLEHIGGSATGRLYEGDVWLRGCLPGRVPRLSKASELLSSYGVTGVTDSTPSNGYDEWILFREALSSGELHQSIRVMGNKEIAHCEETDQLRRGEFKIHLLESQLPELDQLCGDIREAHAAGRAVATHCVTQMELVFAMGALQEAGVIPGDRIEHASVCSPDLLATIRQLGLRIVTQPHFIAERGDQYINDVEPDEQPWLYRANSFVKHDIPLAGGSDAPFGSADPWRAMRAAVKRTTPSSTVINSNEKLSPEQALGLFLSPPTSPGSETRRITAGSQADLCLLHNPWKTARQNLSSQQVRCTWHSGELVYQSG